MGTRKRRQQAKAGASRRRIAPTKPEPSELVLRRRPGQTTAETTGELIAEGLLSNGLIAAEYAHPFSKTVSLTECVDAVTAAAQAVASGDMKPAEALLMAQVMTLNAMFTEFAHRATTNRGNPEIHERYIRLAFKAQSQCRATVETVATVKNPPVFTRQANIAHGPQQVNNQAFVGTGAPRVALESSPNKLLEGAIERVDTRTAGESGASDPSVEAVAAVYRPAHSRRQGARSAKRLPRRRSRQGA